MDNTVRQRIEEEEKLLPLNKKIEGKEKQKKREEKEKKEKVRENNSGH